MKEPFSDTETGSPYKWEDGWYVDTYTPVGTETMHGPYRTRKRARWAQHGLKKPNKIVTGNGSFILSPLLH